MAVGTCVGDQKMQTSDTDQGELCRLNGSYGVVEVGSLMDKLLKITACLRANINMSSLLTSGHFAMAWSKMVHAQWVMLPMTSRLSHFAGGHRQHNREEFVVALGKNI